MKNELFDGYEMILLIPIAIIIALSFPLFKGKPSLENLIDGEAVVYNKEHQKTSVRSSMIYGGKGIIIPFSHSKKEEWVVFVSQEQKSNIVQIEINVGEELFNSLNIGDKVNIIDGKIEVSTEDYWERRE